MSGSLNVQPGSLRTYSQQHGDVASAVSSVAGRTPGTAELSTSYGNIAYGMTNALGTLLDARGGALQTTAATAQGLSEKLSSAAGMYEKSDQDGASAVSAASGQSGSPASAAGGPGSAMGQMAGQLGQQASQLGQMAQSAGQSLSGLTQIPQQVLQGVQGLVETAMGAAGGDATGLGADAGPGAGGGEGDPPVEPPPPVDGPDPADDKDPERGDDDPADPTEKGTPGEHSDEDDRTLDPPAVLT